MYTVAMESDLERVGRQQLGLRVGKEMAAFVQRRLDAGAASIPLIGRDARTGLPVNRTLDAQSLKETLARATDSNAPRS